LPPTEDPAARTRFVSLLVQDLENSLLASAAALKLEPVALDKPIVTTALSCGPAAAANTTAASPAAPSAVTQSMGAMGGASGGALLLPPPADAAPVRFDTPAHCAGGDRGAEEGCEAPSPKR
jgi:hypothetical protein